MKTIGDRLRYVIVSQGYSILSFATEFDINYSGLTQILNNKRPLGMEVLQQLKSAIPKIDSEWLLFGTEREGNVSHFVNVQDNKTTEEPMMPYSNSDPVENMFLQYLDRPSVQNKIREILK